MRVPVIISLTVLICSLLTPLFAQEDFFMDDWVPRSAELPPFVNYEVFTGMPETIIETDVRDTTAKIGPNLFGYCLNTFYGPYHTVAPLLQDIRNLDASVLRIPAGSGSNYYFWDRSGTDGIPEDADISNFKPGVGNSDYMSLDNYYRLIYDSLQASSVNVINYSYARYGTSEDPVAKAAGYAADWVRYDSGKTRYWEIGNENYGSWEEGYKIDTSKNLDGQPEIQTGRLYGQHFRVFADSMRKAAAETGVDIKIGAVGYWGTLWPGSRAEWNRQMIPECGATCDFVSIHHYFKGNSTGEILQSAYTMHKGPEQIHQWFDLASIPRVPIALTEWNINKDIGPGCLNGMHAVIGIKNLVMSGIGLATRWNLVWSYNNGATHGHLSTDRDYSVEGNRAWGPRANYYYFYYARQILGEMMIHETIHGSSDIESMVSTFSSGQVGMIIVNKGDRTEDVTVDISGFNPGNRYFWYELKGENGNPRSEKIYINDESSGPEYQAGGAAGYETIRARSGLIRDGINIKSGPYTTCFILVEGDKAPAENQNEVSFVIYGEEPDGTVYPLQDAIIVIGSRSVSTDSLGRASLEVSNGMQSLTLRKTGYFPEEFLFNLENDTVFSDTLVAKTYDLHINVREIETGDSIEGCLVKVGPHQAVTDHTGKAEFTAVPSVFSVVLEKEHYIPPDGPEFEIWKDTTLTLHMAKEKFSIAFNLFDKYSENPLWNSMVIMEGDTAFTDSQGKAVVDVSFGIHSYIIEDPDYEAVTGTISVESDSSFQLFLKPVRASVKFQLSREETPVNNALITLLDATLLSNSLGMATFYGLPASVQYEYDISKKDFESITGELYLRTDTTIQVEMVILDTRTRIKTDDLQPFVIWPNPANHTIFVEIQGLKDTGKLVITDAGGRIMGVEIVGIAEKYEVNISYLEPGIYYVSLCTSNRFQTGYFVK